MKKIASVFVALLLLLPVLGTASWSEGYKTMMGDMFIGNWKPSNGRSVISIYKGNSANGENPNKYYGKIVWLLEPNDANGKPRTDVNNPDANKRNNPLKGLLMVKDMEFIEEEDGVWYWDNGTIYDPNNGSEYSFAAEMDKNNQNTLSGRGYIGVSLFGRTDTWTRLVKK